MRSTFRRLRTPVSFGIAAALLTAWWTLRDGADAPERARGADTVPVFAGERAIPVDAVDRITLTRDGTTYEMARDGVTWRQTAPVACDIDPYSARQLVVEAADLASERTVDLPGEGFDVASLTLAAGDRSWTLHFGKRGVAGRAFVRAPEGPGLVVSGPLYERAVEMDPREWRSRFLFPESLGRPTRIVWNDRSGATELVRDGERWSIRGTSVARADPARVDELLASVARARSEGFLADAPSDLATYGLAQPAVTLTVHFAPEGGGPAVSRSLLVGSALGVGTKDRYALLDGSPFVVRLGATAQSTLFPRPGILIEPTGSGRRPADVKRVEVRPREGDGLELVRELDRWTVARITDGVAGPAAPCDGAMVERLLRQLCVDRAPEIALGPYPAEMEAAQVLLFGYDGRPIDVVRIARDATSGKWGLENGDGALRVFPAATPLALSADAYGAPE